MNYIVNFIEALYLTKKVKKKTFALLNYIFRSLNFKEFHTIDDYRNIKLISDLCEFNHVKLNIYQHGRFSTSLKNQSNLSKIKFENILFGARF